jgi:ribose transport system substrate-binding protein
VAAKNNQYAFNREASMIGFRAFGVLAAAGAAALAFGAAAFGSQARAADSFTIGLSNGWVGSEWRTQMIEEAQAAAAAWKDRGVEVKLVIQSSDVDVQGQIAAVRNFINQGVNAIIINPNSPTAFDPIFAQAKARGILVVATDAEVSSKDAMYIGIDQKGWAMQSAEWLAKALGGKGSVVAINGVAGHPANQMRVDGYREVFAKHPDIKILNEANANWDEAQGQQTAQTLLATYPDLNGIWVQDGMAAGAWRAIAASGRKDIAATGEIRVDFLKAWKEGGYNSGASVNPPGVMASALNVTVLRLQGREFKDGVFGGVYGNAIYLPIPFIDNTNFDAVYESVKDKPAYHSVTSTVSVEDAGKFFK